MSWNHLINHPAVAAIGVVAAALSGVVAVAPACFSLVPYLPLARSSEGSLQVDGSGNVRVDNGTVPGKGDRGRGKKADDLRFVPKTYLNNLPALKCQAYDRAREFWDSGITSRMIQGNSLVASELKEILVDLARNAYPPEFFGGRDVETFYEERIREMMRASYEASPNQGSMYQVIASGDERLIVDEMIVDLVGRLSDPADFSRWMVEWERAEERNCSL